MLYEVITNLLDVEGVLGLLHEFEETAAVVVKHRNPSGAAMAGDAGKGAAIGAASGALIGGMRVITSYSIHYTKLYESPW